MKKLICLPLFILLVFFISCYDNPISEISPERDISWVPAFTWGGPYLFKGGPYGNNFLFASATDSGCSVIRIKAKYISYYDERFFPPEFNAAGYGSYYSIKLRKTKYTTFDTILQRYYQKDSMIRLYLNLVSANLLLDSLFIMRGYYK